VRELSRRLQKAVTVELRFFVRQRDHKSSAARSDAVFVTSFFATFDFEGHRHSYSLPKIVISWDDQHDRLKAMIEEPALSRYDGLQIELFAVESTRRLAYNQLLQS